MLSYHKIQTVYKRDPASNFKNLLEGDYSLPAFAYLKDNLWVFTEKVDGTNIRVIVEPDPTGTAKPALRFAGKTDDAQMPPKLLARLKAIFEPQSDAMFAQFPTGACLYGEGYGAQIQKGGGNYGPTQDFVLFDVLIGSWWLERSAVEAIGAGLGLRVAPIIGEGTLTDMVEMARNGIASQLGNFAAEGIVARPKVELHDRNNERIITKIKSRDFVLAQPKRLPNMKPVS